MARNYHDEYLARKERAIARGFTSFYQERRYREENRSVLKSGLVETIRDMFPNADLGPREIVGLYDVLGGFLVTGETEITGRMRHDLVAFYMEQGLDEDDAVEAMREVLGTS